MSDEIEISAFGNNLVYKNGYTPEFVARTLEDLTLTGLKVNTRWERLPSLDFLAGFDFLESLDLTGYGDFDYSFLFFLKKLKRLSLSIDGTNSVDLRNQINLESLTILWRKRKIIGLENCDKIASMCLVDYGEDDFTPIGPLAGLDNLRVKTASVKTLNGLESLSNLRMLLLGNCKHLSRIDSLEGLTTLVSLSFELCPKIRDYESIGYLSNLQELQITDCKGINTIKFVERLPHLEKLSLLGDTDVLDGDLSPARNIKEVFYKPRQHHNIRIVNKEYRDLIKQNRGKVRRIVRPDGGS